MKRGGVLVRLNSNYLLQEKKKIVNSKNYHAVMSNLKLFLFEDTIYLKRFKSFEVKENEFIMKKTTKNKQ